MQLLRVAWALTGAAICCFLILLIHSRLLKEGQLAAGTCEIVTLDRDSSQPRRTIARQTARCACKKGQIAGTTRARPACVDAGIVRKKQWCEMVPCLEDEGCDLLVNKSGWTCTQPGGRVKTTTREIVVRDDTADLPSTFTWQQGSLLYDATRVPLDTLALWRALMTPMTDSKNPPTNTTTNISPTSSATTITTGLPIPWSRKGRNQHKQLQSAMGLIGGSKVS